MLTLSTADYLWFVDDALDEMTRIVTELGDELASTRPPFEGANAPYAILTHCLGVMEFWGGAMVAGRAIERDRDAEFQATGSVAELAQRAAEARRKLEADLVSLDSKAPPVLGAVLAEDEGKPIGTSQGGVLLHLLRELTQHLGQMELSRDALKR